MLTPLNNINIAIRRQRTLVTTATTTVLPMKTGVVLEVGTIAVLPMETGVVLEVGAAAV